MNKISQLISKFISHMKTDQIKASLSRINGSMDNKMKALGSIIWKASIPISNPICKLDTKFHDELYSLDKLLSKSSNPSAAYKFTFDTLYRVLKIATLRSIIENNFSACIIEIIIASYIGYLLASIPFFITFSIWKNLQQRKSAN